ncbi:hypothetical protein AVEN_12971-1 [Araneus ventricosus]|uniref:Uncharacterized protein n=1 Tax=Araneus ventricosus TaxID=182803 RepID=A0A4Y2L9X9_ARAVE|nr:hypothetical protein AVEN_12971-1 [Araneus ventricosus]
MIRTTTELVLPSPKFHTIPTGRHLASTYDFTLHRPQLRRIFSRIEFRTWNLLAPEAETLPLCHLVLSLKRKTSVRVSNSDQQTRI